jgi:hypothetical protein
MRYKEIETDEALVDLLENNREIRRDMKTHPTR